MAIERRLTKVQLKLSNVVDLSDGSTKRTTTYFSDIISAATDQQIYDLAEAIDSINAPIMEDAYKVETYQLRERV